MPAWLTARFWSNADRAPSGAWGASALMHVCGLLLLSTLWTAGTPRPSSNPVDSAWSAERPAEVVSLDPLQVIAVPLLEGPAEGRSDSSTSHGPRPARTTIRAHGTSAVVLSELIDPPLAGVGLGEEVGPLETGDEDDGAGEGDGTGTGSGTGAGRFFGLRPKGSSIVFVLDCSRSMNHPDNTDAKTRFRRLKLELVKAVAALPADSRFFIVFFSETAWPMPAGTLVHATDAQKQRQLAWLAQMKADGDTDPRPAMAMALRMKPDTICFLTDGAFDLTIEKDLLRIRQTDTVIHTFAFGNETKIEPLRKLAKNNGGKFRFIP